ncbi:MAG: UDP-N-acetylmuramate dehydrogenase [Lachnospiraceae bacterium]|nr:UDP-N-acetylmuramate dehydrogenase [Lachnospiraceae bacterium]
MSRVVLDVIRAYVPGDDVLEREPMCRHTTFRVGGKAACFVRISSIGQLQKLIPYFEQIGLPYFILGNGSNLLVSDDGYDGVILQVGDKFGRISTEGNHMEAQAGALLSAVARCALEHGLTGLEFASGIPGTIGGGVVMNAGAYGGEMKQVVTQVRVLGSGGEILTLDREAMEFGYRSSVIKNRRFTVLTVTLELACGDKKEIQARVEELARRRREKQPLEYPSAGSTFKRPEGYFAGKLIMEAGLKGYSVGGARVSEKHCGFLVNTGDASAADVAALIREVQERVKDKTGVSLEREVVYLGNL